MFHWEKKEKSNVKKLKEVSPIDTVEEDCDKCELPESEIKDEHFSWSHQLTTRSQAC